MPSRYVTHKGAARGLVWQGRLFVSLRYYQEVRGSIHTHPLSVA
jgi:hypothetical protein